MPQIILNATAAQASRLEQARIRYNAQNGTNLATKPFIYFVLEMAVQTYLGADAEDAAQAVRVAIAADMEGGT